jgi:hypothetical protein
MAGDSKAPWTWAQVVTLNAYQRLGTVHPFTCGVDTCRAELVAYLEGWKCPNPDCVYTQGWAHAFMADPAAIAPRMQMEMEMYWKRAKGQAAKDVEG